jgi:hypothetical protein
VSALENEHDPAHTPVGHERALDELSEWARKHELIGLATRSDGEPVLHLAPGASALILEHAREHQIHVQPHNRYAARLTSPDGAALTLSARTWTGRDALTAACALAARWNTILTITHAGIPVAEQLAAELPDSLAGAASLAHAALHDRQTLGAGGRALLRSDLTAHAVAAWEHGPFGSIPDSGPLAGTLATLISDRVPTQDLVTVDRMSPTLRDVFAAVTRNLDLLPAAAALARGPRVTVTAAGQRNDTTGHTR